VKKQGILENQVKLSYLALGSNLGNKFHNLGKAKFELEKYNIKILKSSSNFLSVSWPDSSKPQFLNIVLKIETNMSVIELLKICNLIEQKLGRIRSKKNDPRTCDIDIIDYNNKILDFKYNNLDFSVPHKELVYRSFVLMPLQEILPKWIHPETSDSIEDLVNRLSDEQKKSILKIKKS